MSDEKRPEQIAFENNQLKRRANAMVSLADSAKRFVDLLERIEEKVLERLEQEEKKRVR